MAGQQGTIGIKQIGLWRAVDAELKSQFAVGVGQYGAIGVARLDKPGAGRIPFVAIVETVEGHGTREFAEQRMFGAAVGAPAGPDVKHKGLALEAGGLDWTPIQQIVALPRRQGTPERCLILAVGVVAKAEPEQGAEAQGQQQGNKEAQAGSHNASCPSW